MIGFSTEARVTLDFLIKTGIESPIAEVAESRFAEATGLVKYPLLAQQITMKEYDELIGIVHEARQKRFRNLLVDHGKMALQARNGWLGERP